MKGSIPQTSAVKTAGVPLDNAFTGPTSSAPDPAITAVIESNLSALREQWLAAADHLSRTVQLNAFTLFAYIYAAVYESFRLQGFTMRAASVTTHLSARLVQIEFATARASYTTYMKHLQKAGLVLYRPQSARTPWNWNAHLPEEMRRTRRTPDAICTGTLLAIRMLPGEKAPVRYHWKDFEESPRDFYTDLATGNTVAAYERHLTTSDKSEAKLRKLRWKNSFQKNEPINLPTTWLADVQTVCAFALPSCSPAKTPLLISVQKFSEATELTPNWVQMLALEDVFTLPDVTPRDLPATINALALKLIERLGDDQDSKLWHWILWRLWALALTGRNYLGYFIDQVVSITYDAQRQSALKSNAAALISRLQRSGIWDELKNVELGSNSIQSRRHRVSQEHNEEPVLMELRPEHLEYLQEITTRTPA